MSKHKMDIRDKFRKAVFLRDGYRCRICGNAKGPFDAHHITPRKDMPHGGYVAENGITLCRECHVKAETDLQGEVVVIGWTAKELYEAIESSKEEAVKACGRL